MGATDPKSVKEVLVYPLDAPTTMEDFVNPNGVVPSWQSRPTDYNLEEDLLHDVLVEHSKILLFYHTLQTHRGIMVLNAGYSGGNSFSGVP